MLYLAVSCSDAGLASILKICRNVLTIIQILGPILAGISAVINLTKAMANPEDKKLMGRFKTMIIALLMLFFIPTIVDVSMRMFDNSFNVSACWNETRNN